MITQKGSIKIKLTQNFDTTSEKVKSKIKGLSAQLGREMAKE